MNLDAINNIFKCFVNFDGFGFFLVNILRFNI